MERKQNLLFLLFNYPVFATKQFFRFKKWTDTTGHNFRSRRKCSISFVHFSSAWPQSKIHLKRQKANLGHARNGWNRRIFVYFFSSFVWKIKSASGCRIVQDFTRLRAVPADLSSPLARVWRLHLTKSKRTCQNHRKKLTSTFWLREKPIIIVKLKKRYAFQTKLLKPYQHNYWRAET